jgi:UDP-N-acetylglucosamine--N-acetylmuramyl-(pentapeptide) pyrophosphoryl-undecaprenol N-acetylglucosamine transferase
MNINHKPSMIQTLKVIIAGGGTGGHIFPAIAIANALKQQEPSIQILFVGANGKMEMEKIPQAGYNIKGIDIAGFNRSSLIKNISLPFKLIKSFFQVRHIFKAFSPNAAIGVGGYSTFPVLKYAQAKSVPTFIHESNSFAGKANIMLGRNAVKIFVATNGMQPFFPENKLVVTGNPVRKEIAQNNITKEEALAFFNLNKNKKTVLVIGGSLGAKSINDAIANNINVFEENNLQLIWQTGKLAANDYHKLTANKNNIWCNHFINQMEMAYKAADIVVSRAGAMAVTELSISGKAVIFVPFPFAAEDHQTVNAKVLVNKNAALMIKDNETKEKLISEVIKLSKNEELMEVLRSNISLKAIADADTIIAKEILNTIK